MLNQVKLDGAVKAACANVIAIGSSRMPKITSLSRAIMDLLPAEIKSAVEKWNSRSITEFPAVGAWVSCVTVYLAVILVYVKLIYRPNRNSLLCQINL